MWAQKKPRTGTGRAGCEVPAVDAGRREKWLEAGISGGLAGIWGVFGVDRSRTAQIGNDALPHGEQLAYLVLPQRRHLVALLINRLNGNRECRRQMGNASEFDNGLFNSHASLNHALRFWCKHGLSESA